MPRPSKTSPARVSERGLGTRGKLRKREGISSAPKRQNSIIPQRRQRRYIWYPSGARSSHQCEVSHEILRPCRRPRVAGVRVAKHGEGSRSRIHAARFPQHCLPLYGKPVPCQDPNQIPPCPPAIVVERAVRHSRHAAGVSARVGGWGIHALVAETRTTSTRAAGDETRVPENLASSVSAGGLDDPNTVVLFGEQNSRTDPQIGGRLTANVALDAEGSIVLQASGFYLPLQVERFSAQSNAAGQPALALPFNQVAPGTPVETSYVVAGPFDGGTLHGNVLINNGTEMWGGEVNLMTTLACTCAGEFDAIYRLSVTYICPTT